MATPLGFQWSLEEKQDSNYTRMLCAVLNKSWKQPLTKQQLYDHLPPISQTIHVRWTRHAGHCWKSSNELISDIIQWTPTCEHTSVSQPAKTYIHHFCAGIGCCLDNLPRRMADRDWWQERVKGIWVISITWWWWWWWWWWWQWWWWWWFL